MPNSAATAKATLQLLSSSAAQKLKKNYYSSDEIDPNWVPVKTEELVQTLSENI